MRRTASSMVVILAVAAASAFNSPAIAIQPTVAASDMRLELSCHRGRQSRTLSLEVRLRNESGADTAVVLGLVLGNGAHLSMALTVLSGKLGPSPEEFRYSPLSTRGFRVTFRHGWCRSLVALRTPCQCPQHISCQRMGG